MEHRFRVDAVLFDLNAGVQRFRCVVREDGDFGLENDFSGIHSRVDVMNGAA